MHLVDQVHLVAPPGGRVLHVIEQVAGIVDLGLRRGIDLDEVDETPLVDLPARAARAAGFRSDALLAIQGLRQDARDRGLADAAVV